MNAWVLTSKHVSVSTGLFDRTYKTNSSKLELFTIILSVLAVRFPITYVVLGNAEDDAKREDIVSELLEVVKESYQG